MSENNDHKLIYNVLIMDAQPERVVLEALATRGIRANVAKTENNARELLSQGSFNLVFVSSEFDLPNDTDNVDSAKNYSRLIKVVSADFPEMPVVMISGVDTAPAAKLAIRTGYADFLGGDIDREQVEQIVDTYMPNRSVPVMDAARHQIGNIYHLVGASGELANTIRLAKKIAATSTPVLISGESGTGKELIASLIHNNSKRRDNVYVKVNCASLNESLMESEMFGHEKGSFTGAQARRIGRFERAHGGTLLLDEITETPAAFQAKLLRVLEEQDIERVGGNDRINVNVRVVATTNRDILSEVQKGNFRADLYYRLAGIRLVVPPLRDRKDDILPLTWHFVNQLSCQCNRRIEQLDPGMINVFHEYHWPGNIRQLRNVVRTSLVLGEGPVLTLADVSWLSDEIEIYSRTEGSELADFLGSISLAELEKQAIIATLRQTSGNQLKAAKVLGVSDRTVREKIKRYKNRDPLVPAS